MVVVCIYNRWMYPCVSLKLVLVLVLVSRPILKGQNYKGVCLCFFETGNISVPRSLAYVVFFDNTIDDSVVSLLIMKRDAFTSNLTVHEEE
jgi:hypothetical protein